MRPMLREMHGLGRLRLQKTWRGRLIVGCERSGSYPMIRGQMETWITAMMIGLTVLAVLTIIAIGEIYRTQIQPSQI